MNGIVHFLLTPESFLYSTGAAVSGNLENAWKNGLEKRRNKTQIMQIFAERNLR